MSQKLKNTTNVTSVDSGALFYAVDLTRATNDRDVNIKKSDLQNDLVVPLLPSGLPPIENRYGNISELLDNQGSQTEGFLQYVKDASEDPNVASGRAYYLKTDTTTGSLDDYIRQTDDVANALDAGQGKQTADCGTVIPLDTVYGHNCNMQSANANTAYTINNENLINAYARVLINAASEPTVSGATQRGGVSFVADTNMILLVENLGDAGIVYSFNPVSVNTGEADTLQTVTTRGATTTTKSIFQGNAQVGDVSEGELDFGTNGSQITVDGGEMLLRHENNNYALDKAGMSVEIVSISGNWNASTNSPTLANTDTGVKAVEYKVSVAGTQDFGAGNITFAVGDIVANDGTIWYKKVDNNQGKVNEAGNFNGSIDLTNIFGTYYNDYRSGDVVNLSLASSPVVGGSATVRIQGDLTGTIPNDWNISGDGISSASNKLNELTLLYVSSSDIRIVNRVFDAPDITSPTITSFVIPGDNASRIEFQSSEVITATTFGGFTLGSGKTITGITINAGQTTGHYFTVNSAYVQGDGNDTIQYSGTGCDMQDASSNALEAFGATTVTNNVTDFDADFQAWLTYLSNNSFDTPSPTEQDKLNTRVVNLKAVGAWSRMDLVYMFDSVYTPTSFNANYTRVNMKDPSTFTANQVSVADQPNFDSGNGFTKPTTPAQSRHLTTGFNTAVGGTNWQYTDASNCDMGIIFHPFNFPDPVGSNVWAFGSFSGSFFGARNNTSAELGVFFGSGEGVISVPTQADLNSHFHLSRINGTLDSWRNGVSVANTAGSFTTMPNLEMFILELNNGGTDSNIAVRVGMKYLIAGDAMETLQSEIYDIMTDNYTP